jgi:hypothetical protein
VRDYAESWRRHASLDAVLFSLPLQVRRSIPQSGYKTRYNPMSRIGGSNPASATGVRVQCAGRSFRGTHVRPPDRTSVDKRRERRASGSQMQLHVPCRSFFPRCLRDKKFRACSNQCFPRLCQRRDLVPAENFPGNSRYVCCDGANTALRSRAAKL